MNNKNIVIQKSDKGNSVILLDNYLEEMSKILNNNAKFKMLQFGPVILYDLGKVHKPVAV